MSSFLDELKQSAMTEKEILQKDAVIKQQEEIRKERLQVQYKKDFEDFLLRCLPKIKQRCLAAVKSANYITYNDKRYLICTLQLKQSHSYNYDGSDDDFYIEFSCNKLKKMHLLESKKEYYIGFERFNFDYIIKNTKQYCWNYKFEEVGFERIGRSNHYKAPEYVDLPNFAKKHIEGYTDISVIPKKKLDINFPPIEGNSGSSFTSILSETRFLIAF